MWSASAVGLLYRGSWCGVCAGNVFLGIKECVLYAKKNQGKCLSSFPTPKRPPVWECRQGHRWKMHLNRMMGQNSWCDSCARKKAGMNKRFPFKEAKRLASLKGGLCLSRAYRGKGKQALYRWRCVNGHEWNAVLSQIKQGQWCASCYRGTQERCVRLCFEKIFRTKFPKTRPFWLKSPSGRLLELDGYNKALRLAFEHQGRHHIDPKTYYYRNSDAFKHRKVLDSIKRKECRRRGIRLIATPELDSRLNLLNLKDFILAKLKKSGVQLPEGVERIKINFASAYRDKVKNRIEAMGVLAKRRGGFLHDSQWLGWNHRYKFSCKCGNNWNAFPQVILNNGWCQRCANKLSLKKAMRARGF